MKRIMSAVTFLCAVLAPFALMAQEAPAVTERPVDPASVAEPQDGAIILAPGEGQVFTVDEDGKIYEKRGYKGVVPGVRENADFPPKPVVPVDLDLEIPVVVNWVGFQPFEAFSRVFIQVSGEFEFSVTRPSPTKVEVSIPGASPGSENDLNGLITRWFPTAIDRIEVRQMPVADPSEEGGMTVTIHLKKPVGYLYRKDRNYVFVDVEM